MCLDVWFNGERITTVGEMRAAVGEPVWRDGDGGYYPEDKWCLCGLDTGATAAKHGLIAGEDVYGDIEFRRPA